MTLPEFLKREGFCGAKALRNLRKHNVFVAQKEKWDSEKEYIIYGIMPDQNIDTTTTPRGRVANILLSTEPNQKDSLPIPELQSLINKVRQDIDDLILNYIPPRWQKRFNTLPINTLLPYLENTINLWKALKNKNQDTLDKTEFEILRTLELIRRYFFISRRYQDWQIPEQTEKESLTSLFLTDQIFSKIQRKKAAIFYDPKDDWRCSAIIFFKDFDSFFDNVREKEDILPRFRYKIMDLESAYLKTEPPIEVVLERRQKNYLSIIAKLLRAEEMVTDPQLIVDRYGLRLAYINPKDIRRGEEFIQQKLWEIGKEIRRVPSFNQYSSRRLNLEIQYAFTEGKLREIQHLPLQQLFNIQYSTGEENHTLYHARWHTAPQRGLFHQLFPLQFYAIDWNREGVQKKIFEYIKSRFEKKMEQLPRVPK